MSFASLHESRNPLLANLSRGYRWATCNITAIYRQINAESCLIQIGELEPAFRLFYYGNGNYFRETGVTSSLVHGFMVHRDRKIVKHPGSGKTRVPSPELFLDLRATTVRTSPYHELRAPSAGSR